MSPDPFPTERVIRGWVRDPQLYTQDSNVCDKSINRDTIHNINRDNLDIYQVILLSYRKIYVFRDSGSTSADRDS